MEHSFCPNYTVCKLVKQPGFGGKESQRLKYLKEYCEVDNTKWESCKRFIAKNTIHFCPDFVLPDTPLSMNEIIDRFDKENENV
jgi:hypothetical protein